MKSKYSGMAIAGTAEVYCGDRHIKCIEQTRPHYSMTSTSDKPEFVELINIRLVAPSYIGKFNVVFSRVP